MVGRRELYLSKVLCFFVFALCFDVALLFKNYDRVLVLGSKSDVEKNIFY